MTKGRFQDVLMTIAIRRKQEKIRIQNTDCDTSCYNFPRLLEKLYVPRSEIDLVLKGGN